MAWFIGRSGRIAAGLLLLLSLVACRATVDGRPTTAMAGQAAIATAIPSVTAAGRPPTATAEPAAIATVAAPPSPTGVATSTPRPEASALSGTPDAPTPTSVAATPTSPPPTFTPPPPPPPVEGEHLLLRRPVADPAPMWTDKAYPYGGTKGGTLRPHTGVEFDVPIGTPVLATASGIVAVAGDDSQIAYGPQTDFYGNLVILQLDNPGGPPLFTLYGHLSEVGVAVGQTVAAGDVIGLSGESGIADGPHLHFEVRSGENDYGTTRNPLLWLIPLPETGIVAGRVVGPGGELLHEAPVALIRADGPAPYTATTSYALGEPNADGALGENFALDDVEPGFYQAVVEAGGRRSTVELWVYPGRVNWVELVGP